MKNCCSFKCCPNTPSAVACLLVRISFGLSLFFVGFSHYRGFEGFKVFTASGLGRLTGLGEIWAYILPALMIVGGILLVFGVYKLIAAWCAGLALASIPAGMLSKTLLSGLPVSEAMPAVINAFIWMLVFVAVVKCACCCGVKEK